MDQETIDSNCKIPINIFRNLARKWREDSIHQRLAGCTVWANCLLGCAHQLDEEINDYNRLNKDKL